MTELYQGITLRDRVLKLLSSDEEYGGPQSIDDLVKNLNISNGSSRSVMIKLLQVGKIERIGHGIYKIKGDKRNYRKNKPYFTTSY